MGVTSAASIISCSGLRKSYLLDDKGGAKLEVLRGIDFQVGEGEMVTIVGASGSGKSTFLHLLGGLDSPSGGSVFWGEQDIFRLGDEQLASLRATQVGFVFQFHHLLPEFTAVENVMMPLLIHRVKPRAALSRAQELLAMVGLSDVLERKPGELSGGEQQRVAVARALANRPGVILADEPTGNLDSGSSRQLQELVARLCGDQRQSFVIVTHNEALAAQAHRVFRMADGTLQAF